MAELVIDVAVELLVVDATTSVVTAGVVVTDVEQVLVDAVVVVVAVGVVISEVELVLVDAFVVVVAPLAVVEGGIYSCAGKHVTLRLPEANNKVTSYNVSALYSSVVTR